VLAYFNTVGVTVLGSGIQLGRRDAAQEVSAQAFLYDTLARLGEDLRDEAKVVVVMLDDMDNFAAVPDVLATLKATLSMGQLRNGNILLGAALTPQAWEELTALEKRHPIARYFIDRVELGLLEGADVESTIRESLAGTGVSFVPKVVDRVVEHTQGHPFEMQVLCYHLFNSQISGRVDEGAWEKALESAARRMGDAVFDRWYQRASPAERRLLSLFGSADTPLSPKQIAAAMADRASTSSIRKHLQRLCDKRLLTKVSRGYYALPDPMFKVFVRMQCATK